MSAKNVDIDGQLSSKILRNAQNVNRGSGENQRRWFDMNDENHFKEELKETTNVGSNIKLEATYCDGCGEPIDDRDEDSTQIPIGNGRHDIDVINLCGECAITYQEEEDALEQRAAMEDYWEEAGIFCQLGNPHFPVPIR